MIKNGQFSHIAIIYYIKSLNKTDMLGGTWVLDLDQNFLAYSISHINIQLYPSKLTDISIFMIQKEVYCTELPPPILRKNRYMSVQILFNVPSNKEGRKSAREYRVIRVLWFYYQAFFVYNMQNFSMIFLQIKHRWNKV